MNLQLDALMNCSFSQSGNPKKGSTAGHDRSGSGNHQEIGWVVDAGGFNAPMGIITNMFFLCESSNQFTVVEYLVYPIFRFDSNNCSWFSH